VVVDGHELIQELGELDQVGGLVGLGAQPLLQRLLEPLDLATGGGLVGAAVLLLDVAAAQLGLQGVAAAAAAGKASGEDHPVVGQGRGRRAEAGHRGQEAVAHDRAGHGLVGGHVQGVAAVIVQPGQDLGVTSRCRGRAGERVVGEVGLPALVRQLCLEPLVGGLGALGGLWVTSPSRVRERLMVATETRMLWWWARCQAMVSGPASRPAVVSLSRSSPISVTVAGGIAVGLVWGRRERGWNAASPSAR